MPGHKQFSKLTIPLNLPPYPFKLVERESRLHIFDGLRKKWLLLTPEEWVRQHFIQFLISEKSIPKGLIKIEGGLKLNTLQKRSDIVVFGRLGNPWLIVECKAPGINITQEVFDQVALYNRVHQATYLCVTNGLQHYYCKMDYEHSAWRFIDNLPAYTG